MRRRDFIAAVVSTLAELRPIVAELREGLVTVGVLWHAGSAEEEKEYLQVLESSFRDHGYTEGKNIRLLHRFPAEQLKQFHVLAYELVANKVDLIIAVTALAAKELKTATSTIPIVFVIVPDPVRAGLVESLAHPGGNLTGPSLALNDLSGKHIGLLRDASPSLSRIALLFDPRNIQSVQLSAYSDSAAHLGIALQAIETPGPDKMDQIFSQIAQDNFDGVIVAASPMLFNERARLGALALAKRLPMLVAVGEMVPYGALMSYGQDFPEYFRKAVDYADKILKGARAADLAVEQPTHFKLVLNMQTAKVLGMTLPPSLVAAADEMIE
jgi:putative tryptophan/tyrosine transport system substrate-binding protein